MSNPIQFFTYESSGGPNIGTLGEAFAYNEGELSIGARLILFKHTEGSLGIGGVAAFEADPSELLLLRGPQIYENDLAEDRLQRTTSYALETTTGIDLTSTGITTIFTAPSDKSALILGVILEATAADTVTVAPQASIGLNPSTNNVFAVEPLIGVDAVGDTYTFWGKVNKAVIVPASGVLDLNISVAATATTLDATARVIGILI